MRKVKITDFARYPSGRTDADGPHNGTRFRDRYILPAICDALYHDHILTVDLDGTRGLSSSFLEEAFGGLVSVCGLVPSAVLQHLAIISEDPSIRLEIVEYIRDAKG